jgi:phosphoribosylanthranilate isomerase
MTPVTKTRIKVCGITRPEDARLAADLGAWAVGMIFVEKSPRALTPEQAERLVRHLPDEVARVGVFMNATVERILKIRRQVGLDLVQLHGSENPKDCERLDPARVIKRVAGPDEADRFDTAYLLVDRPKRETGEITGETDMALAELLAGQGRKVLLAGGLNADNVGEAIQKVWPFAVDLAGGVERAPGIKDPGKLEAFFKAVRAADHPNGPAP